MIATARGLATLAALALVLAIVAIVARPRAPLAVDPTLGFANSVVLSVDVRRTDEAPVMVAAVTSHDGQASPANGAGWQITAPERASAEPATVDALLTALRGARWHRRAATAAAGPTRHVLDVHLGGPTVRIALGNDLPGTDQSWIVVGEHALLVEHWVVRALFPTRLALSVVRPFADVGSEARIRDGQIELAGRRLVKPTALWVDTGRVETILAALADVEIVGFAEPHPGDTGRHIEVMAGRLVDATAIGTCPSDRVLVRFSTGTGCVRREAWQRALDALDMLATAPAEQLADPRIAPLSPETVDINGSTVTLTGTPRVGADDASPDRVGELISALGARGEITHSLPHGSPRATLGVTGQGQTIHLAVFDNAVVREREPVAIIVPASVIAILTRPASALRDPVLWREEVTTLSSIEVDGAVYTRGAVVGEWTGAHDPALVEALASTLATVRAPAGPAPAQVAHTIRVTFTPPAGSPTTHVLAVGAPTASGCPARVDGTPVTLDLALCTAGTAVAGQARGR